MPSQGAVRALLLAAAEAADRAVGAMDRNVRAEKVGDGADGEPTTAVDQAAERAVFGVLAEADWPLRVISEERGELTLVKGPDPIEVLLDPVDSTANAILDLPVYTAALAAFSGDRPLAAVVRNLATHQTYSAEGTERAFFDGRPVHCPDQSLAEAVLAFGPIREPFAQQALLAVVARSRGIRLFACPSWSLAAVADGRLGGFLGLGQKRPVHRLFDVLAAALVVEAAGGVVTDHEGNGWQVSRHDLTTAVTVVAGGRHTHGELLGVLRELMAQGG